MTDLSYHLTYNIYHRIYGSGLWKKVISLFGISVKVCEKNEREEIFIGLNLALVHELKTLLAGMRLLTTKHFLLAFHWFHRLWLPDTPGALAPIALKETAKWSNRFLAKAKLVARKLKNAAMERFSFTSYGWEHFSRVCHMCIYLFFRLTQSHWEVQHTHRPHSVWCAMWLLAAHCVIESLFNKAPFFSANVGVDVCSQSSELPLWQPFPHCRYS